MGQISPQSAAAMVAFQYPPASYEAPSRPAVSPIVSYHQSMSAWGSPPEAMAHFETEFSSPMVSVPLPLAGCGVSLLPSLPRQVNPNTQSTPVLHHNLMHSHSETKHTQPPFHKHSVSSYPLPFPVTIFVTTIFYLILYASPASPVVYLYFVNQSFVQCASHQETLARSSIAIFVYLQS